MQWLEVLGFGQASDVDAGDEDDDVMVVLTGVGCPKKTCKFRCYLKNDKHTD